MRNKTWLFALMLSASALTAAACNDSSSQQVEENDLQYFISCSSPATCTLTLETNQQGNVAVMLSSLDSDFKANFVSAANIQAQRSGTGFTIMDGTSDVASITTDASGVATLSISSGAEAGSGTIVFTAPELETQPASVTFTINVTAPVVPVDPKPTTVDYTAMMSYFGVKSFDYAEAYAVPNGTCSQIISAGMTAKEVSTLVPSQYFSPKSITSGSISGEKFTFQITEETPVTYAVVGRAKVDGEYAAYGCVDGMNAEKFLVTIPLDDVIADEDPVVDPCELDPDAEGCKTDPDPDPDPDPEYCDEHPDDPDCQEDPIVVDGDISYAGNFTLMSQFDALSLLPTASENGETPLFKDMKAGDWIKFVLSFLSNPEEALPNVLTQQLLPLLTDSDWLKNLLSNIPTYGPVIAAMLETMDLDQMLEQFGIKQIITDYLKELTGQIDWWDEATGGVQIANELANNFTLYGKFRIATTDPDENGQISGNTHQYSSVLYHNGTFDKCLIGNDFGTATDNGKICEIPITTLDADAGAVKGSFTAKFSDVAAGAGTVEIVKHNLNLAYGKLIYAALIQIMPSIMKLEDGVKIDSLGDILAYYIGMGAVALYNKNNEDTQISGVSGCDAVGSVLVQLITDKISGEDASGWAKLLSFILQPGFVSNLCTTGINALDNMLDKQIDKLSVSSDKVTFSTPTDKACAVHYTGTDPQKLAYFGMDDYKWGMDSKLDKRCTWNVEIKTSEDGEAKKITGSFNAYSNK